MLEFSKRSPALIVRFSRGEKSSCRKLENCAKVLLPPNRNGCVLVNAMAASLKPCSSAIAGLVTANVKSSCGVMREYHVPALKMCP